MRDWRHASSEFWKALFRWEGRKTGREWEQVHEAVQHLIDEARAEGRDEANLTNHAAKTATGIYNEALTTAAGYGGTAETSDDDEGPLLDRILALEDLNASLIRSVELLAARE